ncbi:MAG: (Fe-S)-binding protein [Deltaproteobacteria bacterium]|nr:(Fe-S)-binding protein [Deltaproteobacteria bacterium]
MAGDLPEPKDLSRIDLGMPETGWMDTPARFKTGIYCHAAHGKDMAAVGMPNAHDWRVEDEDWKLPADWQGILLEGLRERLSRFRSLRIFMDSCVRCGACADKCHFFIGSGDPKNMPVLRAELLRSVYRKNFSGAGKLMGRMVGARGLTEDVLKEWWYYFFQCTECRRCSLFCPYGIDTAEITIIGRELLNLLGLNIDWIASPVAKCHRIGNHIGMEPQTMKESIDFLCDDIEEITGVRINPSFNRKGAEILFVTSSGDYYAEPGIFTCMGYLMLFHQLGLDYTWSTYAAEGGNFGLFTSHEVAKLLNAKIYAEAQRLEVKYILGGECGHMWRVLNQYMDTMNGPPDFLEVPISPVTGTRFDHAASTRAIHICEFTADLIKHNKLTLDPGRNDHLRVTYHDSCNVARGMGMFDEPRHIIKHACKHFYEMPEETIREQTFCCGSGAGLHAGEDMELRVRGGFARANAVRHVHDEYGVNMLSCICAIDRAAFPTLMDYWVPGVGVTGVHELLANALVMDGETERTSDLRGEDLPDAPGEEPPAGEGEGA